MDSKLWHGRDRWDRDYDENDYPSYGNRGSRWADRSRNPGRGLNERGYGDSEYWGRDYSNLERSRTPGDGYGRYESDYHTGRRFTGDPGSRSYRSSERSFDRDYFDRRSRTYDGDYSGNSAWTNRVERDRGYSRDNDRGFWDRASDEVSSWFGDEDAERRRERDRSEEDLYDSGRYGSYGYGQGIFRGKGPKSYQRSDSRIQEDINDRLTDDSFIDASEIHVVVNNSEAVLTGTVNSRRAKRRAEDIVERVSGVRQVENRLRVKDDNNAFYSRTADYNSGLHDDEDHTTKEANYTDPTGSIPATSTET